MLWYQIADTGQSPVGEEGLGAAYRNVYASTVDGLSNPLQHVPIDLLSAREQGQTVTLDFSHWIGETSRRGTCGAAAMNSTFLATFRHYFPKANRLCLTVEGKAGDAPGVSVFHDSVACPFWEKS